jgi:hypothetical protein
MSELLPLTVTDLLAGATEFLENAGYKRIEKLKQAELLNSSTRLFEDVYNIVAVAVYNTWSELELNWNDTQAALVDLISEYIDRGDAKAWDGYLVLMTPTVLAADETLHLTDIRYDTSRLRKLIAAGKELTVLEDLNRLLAPLLPLRIDPVPVDRKSVLDELPSLLEAKGIDRAAVATLVRAYQDQKPLVEALHKLKEQA